MSLKIYEDLDQGSSEWLEARRGIITASVVGQLITPSTVKVANNATSRSKIAGLAAERITGRVEESGWSRDMERGTLDEPYARDAYADHAGIEVNEVGFMLREFPEHDVQIGFSPDGLVSYEGFIEIKSRKPRIQLHTILADEVPAENIAQIQTGLLVTGREWCDYVSYSGGMPLYTKRVYPDKKWQTAILEAAIAAETAIEKMIHHYEQLTKDLPMTEYIDHFEEPELTF